jgi:hypothetical protein
MLRVDETWSQRRADAFLKAIGRRCAVVAYQWIPVNPPRSDLAFFISLL